MMAHNLLVEPEPDFTNLSDFVGVSQIVDDSHIISTLSSVVAQASLGDTNIAVCCAVGPGASIFGGWGF